MIRVIGAAIVWLVSLICLGICVYLLYIVVNAYFFYSTPSERSGIIYLVFAIPPAVVGIPGMVISTAALLLNARNNPKANNYFRVTNWLAIPFLGILIFFGNWSIDYFATQKKQKDFLENVTLEVDTTKENTLLLFVKNGHSFTNIAVGCYATPQGDSSEVLIDRKDIGTIGKDPVSINVGNMKANQEYTFYIIPDLVVYSRKIKKVNDRIVIEK